jgi:hypothetical protein
MLTGYGWLLWGQTLLALAALGLAGGWVLWPYRAANRPYLWLAAPLAGLGALGGALLALYYGAGLRLVPALVLGWSGLCAATLTCLVRGAVTRPAGPERRAGAARFVQAAVLAAAGSLWGAWACNHDSIKAGEPTLSVCDGSDQFGYSMIGDWLRAHSGWERPRPSNLLDVVPYANLHIEASRPATFLLEASASTVRGTSGAFSYDWFCGVVLSAAVLGLAGLFASGSVSAWLLLAAGASSVWMTLARTGYLGKLTCYPGCLLLGFLFLGAWSGPSRGRVAVACLVAPGVALSLNPALPPLALGLILAGLLVALAAHRLVPSRASRPAGPPAGQPATGPSFTWRDGARAVVLYLVVACPTFLVHSLFYAKFIPGYQLPWEFVIPASLDLDNPGLAQVGQKLAPKLVAGMLAVVGLLLLLARRRRNVPAQALLLGAVVVPVAWLLGRPQLYGFHGLLYPLLAAGAALLLEESSRRPLLTWSGVAVALLAAALVALHGPQAYHCGKRYLKRLGPHYPAVFRQSELARLRALVGPEPVDVCLGDPGDGLIAIAELACQGVAVRLHSPAWERTLKNWALGVGYVEPPRPPKARFQLVEGGAYAPPGSVRYRSGRFQLLEDGSAVTFRALQARANAWDEHRRPGFYQGPAPTTLEICNGTGRTAAVRFLAEGRPLPGPLPGPRTIRYQFGDQKGEAVLGTGGGPLALPLTVPPGVHVLSLAAEGPAGQQDLLLWLTNLRLVPLEQEARAGGS